MTRIIGSKATSTLDEMIEVSRQRNKDVAEEERLEQIEAEKRAKEDTERRAREKAMKEEARNAMPADIPIVEEEPAIFNGNEMLMKKARETADKFSKEKYCEMQQLNEYSEGYWIYKHKPEPGWGYHLVDNASMALLHVLLENKTGYTETMKGINKFFPIRKTFWRKRDTYYPSGHGLFCDTVEYSFDANAMMAVLHLATGRKSNAKSLLEIIEKKSKKQGSLLMTKGDSYLHVTGNLLAAIAYAGIDEKERAFDIFNEAKEHESRCIRNYAAKAMLSKVLGMYTQGYYHQLMTGLVPAQWDGDWPVYSNALVACAWAVIGGKELFPKNGVSI
jgi:hypothetical protein